MKNAEEIFRISLGSVAVKRNLHKERELTSRLKKMIMEMLKPLKIENRLTFSLSAVDEGMKQWLLVEATPSLQRELTLHGHKSKGGALATDDFQTQSAQAMVEAAFDLLKRLVSLAKFNPTDFFETVHLDEYRLLRRMAVQTELLEWCSPNGQETSIQPAKLPQRTKLEEDCAVRFKVDMVGVEKALVELLKSDRKRLKSPKAKLHLFWFKIQHPLLMDVLQRHRDMEQWLDALVDVTVNRRGEASSLQFKGFASDDE